MTRCIPTLLLLTAAACASPAIAQEPAAKDTDKVPASIPELKAAIEKILEETKTPGVGITLVSRDKVLWAEGIGLADVANKTPATADTLFRIGSTSKAFVALAALKLRAEGKLDFNATLASLAPEVEFKNPWEATDPVRIEHLLEHTAGFDDVHLREYAYQPAQRISLKEALAYDPDSRTSRWRPGTRFAYCNAGPPIVALVIEKITGVPFDQYVEENFFRPIGMTSAAYFIEPETESRLTKLYAADGVTTFPYWHISVWPSGSINASANDMANYVRFYLNRGSVGDRALLSAADITRLETPGTTLAAKAGITTGYALYAGASFDDDGFLWRGHSGGVQGGGSMMSYLPEHGVGYAFMFNASNGAAYRINDLVRKYLIRDLPKPTLPSDSVAIPDEMASRYAGFYLPANPRVELIGWLERTAGVHRLSFDGGAARFDALLGPGGKRYVGVTPNLLRREDRPLATLALLTPEIDGIGVATEFSTFERVPAVVALGPVVLAASAVLLMLATLLFLPVWAIRGWRGKIALRPHLGLRLWPLASTVLMIAFLGGIALMFADANIFTHYSAVTPRAVALVSTSVLAAVVAWLGLIAVMRRGRRDAHRGLYVHAVLVLGANSLLALYLAIGGVIPFVPWN